MGKEGQPLQIDRKIRRVSGLTALAGAVTLTISGCGGIPQRQFESGEVVDKRYEEAREYTKTNFLLPFHIDEDTIIYPFREHWLDDEDWILTLRNCVGNDCLQRDFYADESTYDQTSIGDNVDLSNNPNVSVSDPDIKISST